MGIIRNTCNILYQTRRRTGAEVTVRVTRLARDVVSPDVNLRLEREVWGGIVSYSNVFCTEILRDHGDTINKQVTPSVKKGPRAKYP